MTFVGFYLCVLYKKPIMQGYGFAITPLLDEEGKPVIIKLN